MYLYVYTYMYMYIHIYIYIQTETERDRERERAPVFLLGLCLPSGHTQVHQLAVFASLAQDEGTATNKWLQLSRKREPKTLLELKSTTPSPVCLSLSLSLLLSFCSTFLHDFVYTSYIETRACIYIYFFG